MNLQFLLSTGYVVTSSVLSVSISVTYTRPSTFNRAAPYYRAGSPLSLTCEATGVEGAFYGWSSNCTGSCFTLGQSAMTVSTSYLESVDSGVHTCTVYGVNGEVGSESVPINVVGEFDIKFSLPCMHESATSCCNLQLYLTTL